MTERHVDLPGGEGWNFAEIWEHVAERFPDALALAHGGRSLTWSQIDRRADGIAATLLAGGAQRQEKVAHYLYNCPEYLESTFAMFKAGLVPVNTNYRYTKDELRYLWDNADIVAVVFHGSFTDTCDVLRGEMPAIRTWIWVDDGTTPCPEWAVDYETAAASATGRVMAPWGRSPDDLWIVYTGGTTGMPKGVMWRQDDLFCGIAISNRVAMPASPGWDELDRRTPHPGPAVLPAAPLMHATGAVTAMWNMSFGSAIVTLPGRAFDPVELLDTVERHKVSTLTVIGDANARPILHALDAEPDRWDISSLRTMTSSGVMWSAEVKAGLLRHNAQLTMLDKLGSSETLGCATATTTASTAASTATFALGPNTAVLADDGSEIAPGSGLVGRLALRGRMPIGYYKDPARSASTFIAVNGERWSIPGDYAEVTAEGHLRLLGRGSQCINTGGEKVYAEEVEEAIKRHPTVADVAVVGVPDERFVSVVAAVVEPRPGVAIDPAALIRHTKETLAGYKAPKHVIVVDSLARAANGKLDYKRLTAEAAAAVASR